MRTYCLVFKVQSSKHHNEGGLKKPDKEASQKLHKDHEPEATMKIN